VHLDSHLLGLGAKLSVEDNFLPMLRLAIEEVSSGNVYAIGFFETDRFGAEL
jgi:hypothetical protein